MNYTQNNEKNMVFKEKLGINEQIQKLEEDGIKFNIFSKEDAYNFLSYNTYFFKLKSYLKNYERNSSGTYTNVDFAYLVEISILDTHFRSKILDLCLSIEHQLKVMLMREISMDENEDGYKIIQKLFEENPGMENSIRIKSNSATNDLINHYPDKMPVWVFLELCSYNSFIKLFTLYFKDKNKKSVNELIPLIYASKFLRNAAAHNNCLLNSLRHPYKNKDGTFRITPVLIRNVQAIESISKKSMEKNLNNHVIHDFIATIYLFKNICTSKNMYRNVMSDLSDLLHIRFLRHKEYFETDPLFTARYRFVMILFDNIMSN